MRVPLGTLMQKETQERRLRALGWGTSWTPAPVPRHWASATAMWQEPSELPQALSQLTTCALCHQQLFHAGVRRDRAWGRGQEEGEGGDQGSQIPPTAQSPGTQLR